MYDRSIEEKIIRSYNKSFNGFTAKLTDKEYENLKNIEEVVSVFPNKKLQLLTTRSWDFLGFPQPTPKQLNIQSDIIIGVLDSGIWPESPSFNDDGLGPIPSKWKGGCFGGKNFTCNKKIIGARTYAYPSKARDYKGHGTHTASTAAGQKVEGANFYGIANGTARGAVPSSRIAVYKVCHSTGCEGKDVMAGFDDAIADGVDMISLSLGGVASQFHEETISIGAFHAMAKGILTVQAVGNSGDARASVASVAPWIFSVAASYIDRHVINKVVLGNGKTLIGDAANSFKLKKDKYPLVYGKATTSVCSEEEALTCPKKCLDKKLVKGKILVCEDEDPYAEAFDSGAIGVLAETRYKNVSYVFPLPAAALGSTEFAALKSYLNSTKAPTANILKSEAVDDSTAPAVAPFSSRGPNSIAFDILKPDISAPGVDILAAYSPDATVSIYLEDTRSVTYNLLSGTSMACPHVTGAAAYVKSLHPDWSPAAIKSALMTTATPMSPSKNPDAEFAYGSGHLNPNNATNPGLVYEAAENDYITFLCKLGYDKKKLGLITGKRSVSCPIKGDSSPKDVNYPSMSAIVNADKPFTVKFSRNVTNVGNSNSTYTASVTPGLKVKIDVNPNLLNFKSLHETKSFDVVVVGEGVPYKGLVSSSIVWSDGIHSVRSPIVVYSD
ncbi:hypothetical protein RND81_05G263500 [Saponaria officinalis]|uniref:Cucumisin n=1 Tax=Saponaria officinalis TaxID=3572 RepID=A0AAW1L136_SAPOF